MRQASKKYGIGLFAVGALLVIAGGVMIPVVDWIVREQIKETVVISNNSKLWDVWSAPPIPIYMQFYMFNLSNPLEVKQGLKPVVVQRGPYTYRERREKYNIVFNDNGTVTYRQRRTFFFMKNMSVGDDSELFTVPNPPVLAVINSLQYTPGEVRFAVNEVLKLYGEDIFMTRPVKEILWGYVDPTLDALNKILPDWFYTDFVGYFIRKNDTDDGLYTVFTGSKSVDNLGVIDKYNGSSYVSFWSTPEANMVNGSDGTISPPFEQNAKQLPMFSSDICRSIYGVYQKEVTTLRDIKLQRYVGSPEELQNATLNPDNIGFCTPDSSRCLPSGLLNISNCQIVDYFKIPVIVSFPHFFMADPKVIDSIGGMHPVAEEHEVAVDVEPWTGQVLQAFKRLQINMFMTQVEGVDLTANIRTVYMPVFWLNESAVVDEKHADMLHNMLFVPLMVTYVLEIVAMSLGGFLVLLAVFVLYRACHAPSKNERQSTAHTNDNRWPSRPVRSRSNERTPLLKDAHVHPTTTIGVVASPDGPQLNGIEDDPRNIVFHDPAESPVFHSSGNSPVFHDPANAPSGVSAVN